MNPLSSPWWLWPALLVVVPLLLALWFNYRRRRRATVSQHLVLGLFVSACWLGALIVILQRVQ